MKLQIGLIRPSLVWEQVCRQEGIPYRVLDLSSDPLPELCSILVVNRSLTNNERGAVEEYLRSGGAIFGCAHHVPPVAGASTVGEQLDYVVSEHDEVFNDIYLMDLAIHGVLPREANVLRTQANTFAMFAGALSGGYAVLLPFNVEEVLEDPRSASKSFYFRLERLPAEHVSLVSKGEVRYLIHRAFEYLHHVRGLCYAHLWYYPNDSATLFAFRLDTDQSSRQDVDEVYGLARSHGCSMSWYLDVKSHERWLKHFHSLVDQELGVHCYEHQTFPTFDANLKNVTRALREMREAGFQPSGFAGPYGEWTPELSRVLEQLGFEYSSEFSYAYDTLPWNAITAGSRGATLQVPIHPICIGSMRRVGYSDAQMIEYYRMVIDHKLQRNEPLFFYHHPVHRRWEVVESLFDTMTQRGIENSTLGDYARWWKKREQVTLEMDLERDVLVANSPVKAENDATSSVLLHLTNARGEQAFAPFGRRIDLKSGLQWRPRPTPIPPPDDIQRIREFDLRGVLGDLYTTIRRKLK